MDHNLSITGLYKEQGYVTVNQVTSLVDGRPWPMGLRLDLSGAYVDDGPSPMGNPGPYLHAPVKGDDDGRWCRVYSRIQVGDTIPHPWKDGVRVIVVMLSVVRVGTKTWKWFYKWKE